MGKISSAAQFPFERTTLWRNAFGTPGAANESCSFFAAHLRSLREKARILVDRIRADIPYLTVHDITHLDALWEIGSIIAGSSYPLTAAEGFVFGAALLLHDAAMCLAAFPEGISDLKKTDEWKDVIATLERQALNRPPNSSELDNPPDEIVSDAIPIVLRSLHARRAEDLPRTKWLDADGRSEYLIDSAEIRDFYGPVIGRVARSHGEPISYAITTMFEQLGPLSSHDGGEVNGLKLACLLRAADAAHIDARRAPHFELALLKPKGTAGLHWTFNNKLAKPSLQGEALVYTSGSSFSLLEADAWWVCFDAIKQADYELRNTDTVLENAQVQRFKARRVKNAGSATALARTVRTENWEPVDAQVKVSDVPRLVQMFGGERLYGKDRSVAIRELIQNSADAIRARRTLQPNFGERNGGEILITLSENRDDFWLEVEDDGIGMSERTMTDTLLDFGRSFWNSDAVGREFPGLMGRGMSPTGKFGIGFFSVFMLGSVVRVTSRRFDAAASDARTLEFRQGIGLRPILRACNVDEQIDCGTRIAVQLNSSPYEEGGFLSDRNILGRVSPKDLAVVVAALCPTLDVSVSVRTRGQTKLSVKCDDWRRIRSDRLLTRITPRRPDDPKLPVYGELVRPVREGNVLCGRACIRPDETWINNGVITVGGFAAKKLPFLEGVLIGSTDFLTRDDASVDVPLSALSEWAEEQADLITASDLSDAEKLIAAGVVIACGGDPKKLPIAKLGNDYLSSAQLARVVRRLSLLFVFEGDPDYDKDIDDCHPREFDRLFEPADEVLFIGEIRSTRWNKYWWPKDPDYRELFFQILKRCWGKHIKSDSDDLLVGHVNDVEIRRPAYVLKRASH